MNKKLTFLVPALNGSFWLNKNKDFWDKAKELVEIIVVEDSTQNEMLDICKDMGLKHFSKENGNWGSVINFAIQKRIIKTEWVAVVDVDDTIVISELEKLIEFLANSQKDVIFTKWNRVDFSSGKNLFSSKDRMIHSTWIRTNSFYKAPLLPEKFFYMDTLFMAYVETLSFENRFEISPYNHFVNIPNQSMELNSYEAILRRKDHLSALSINSRIYVESNNLQIKKKKIKFMETIPLVFIRRVYDKENNRDTLAKLEAIFNELKPHKIPFSKMLIWSKMHRLFKLK